jgi:PEGA domain
VRERARAAYTAGQEAYAAGQYAAAEAHFGLADSLLPAVQAKYWRAMSLDQLGNVPAALAAFELVLASNDKSQLGPEKLAHAEARQRALAATPAELVLTTTPPGARVNVSGVELKAPTPITLRLAPGRHVLRVWLDGYEPQQLELNVTPGAKLTPTLTLQPAANPRAADSPIPALPIDSPPAATPHSPIPGIVTLGIAGASAIVGTIFGIKALGDKEDFDDRPTTGAADDVERNALIADMAFGVTLTLGITGVVLLVADDPMPDQPQVSSVSPQRLRLAPYVAPTGAGAAATLVF